MDIVALWECVPPLLDVCVCNDSSFMPTLRLVNKEASRVVLLAVKSYTLTLDSLEGYNTVCGARLLRNTRLQHLNMLLLLSCDFNPAILLEAFIREAGISLSKLTHLSLNFQQADDRRVTSAAVLDTAMMTLAGVCPALTSFTLQGNVSTSFLSELGKKCPLLSAFAFECRDVKDQAYLQQLLLLQPTLLPNISSLVLDDGCEDIHIPDMTHNCSITSLELEHVLFETDADWLSLPPKLQHLSCYYINHGPPALPDGRPLLSSLLTLTLAETNIPLHSFVQFVCAAPNIQHLHLTPWPALHTLSLYCNMKSPDATTAADLEFLLQTLDMPILKDVKFDMSSGMLGTSHVITSLPVMRGVARCDFSYLKLGELSMLLKVFPDVVEINLHGCAQMTDVELQDLAACTQLSRLKISHSGTSVTPLGLFAICLRLPRLLDVVCLGCHWLKGEPLDGCQQLLQQHGSLARLVYKEEL